MRAKEFLDEATGLSNRTSGTVFKNKAGDEMVFKDLKFYPEQGGAFKPEEFKSSFDSIINNYKTQGYQDIRYINKFTSGVGGFGIAEFETNDNKKILFIRYFQKIHPIFNQNKGFKNDVAGFTPVLKSSEKERAGYNPLSVLTKLDNLTIEDIIQQIELKFTENHPLTKIAKRVAAGETDISEPKGDVNYQAFRDYFCEILQPISVIVGTCKGNINEAADKFLEQDDFSGCTVSFNIGKAQGLQDSELTSPTGGRVKLSTKAGKGAAASSSNLLKSLNDIQRRNIDIDIDPETSFVLDAIQNNTNVQGPITLGLHYGFIDQKDANFILGLRNTNLSYNQLDKTISSESKKIHHLWTSRKPKAPDIAKGFYHLMASLAYKVSKHVNENTTFSKDCSKILNMDALIQIRTSTRESGGNIVLESFSGTYPSEAASEVKLYSEKNYYGTDIKDKLSFLINPREIKKDQAEPIDDKIKNVEVEKQRVSKSFKTSVTEPKKRTKR